MCLCLAILQLMIVEQGRYKLQQMLCRVLNIMQIVNGFGTVYIVGKQAYEAGN